MEQSSKDFKSKSGAEIVDVPWYKSSRFVLAIISAWGYTFFYILRIDLSMAIVCMARDPDPTISPHLSNHSIWDSQNLTDADDDLRGWIGNRSIELERCSESSVSSNSSRPRAELEWSKELRGYILGSFFYGYLVTQIPGGWLASRYGGKHVFGGGILITLIATALVPVAARASPYWMIGLRVIMGLGCGVGFPATHHLYSLWVPPLERSKMMTFSYAGTMIGTIFALLFSGFLCDVNIDNGWPLIFYVYAGAAFVWWILWNLLVYNSPHEHPRIEPDERLYITSLIDPSVYESHKDSKIPWRSIMTSGPVWAIIVAHCCNNWTNYTVLVCAPMYMKEVLKFDVKQNGSLSALPYVFSYFVSIFSGQLSDRLIARRVFSTKVARKLAQNISTTIPAVTLIGMGYVDCEMRSLAVVLLCLTIAVNSSCRAGFMINHVDISPRHSGILFGISNTFATVPGILAPIVVGYLTTNGSREEWLTVFYICGGLFAFSTIVYAVLADGEPQKWSMKNTSAGSVAVAPVEHNCYISQTAKDGFQNSNHLSNGSQYSNPSTTDTHM